MKKAAVLHSAEAILKERISEAERELSVLKEAIAKEIKSSAGDKFETSREMMNQERMKLSAHLKLLLEHNANIKHIDLTKSYKSVEFGALVKTSTAYLLISSAIGKIYLEESSVMLISTIAPLFLAMKGMEVNETFTFRDREIKILGIF